MVRVLRKPKAEEKERKKSAESPKINEVGENEGVDVLGGDKGKRTRKSKLHFTDRMWFDLLMLTKVHNPWASEHGAITKTWSRIAVDFNTQHRVPKSQLLDWRMVRPRVEDYLAAYKAKDAKNRASSGISEEYRTIMDVCNDLLALKEAGDSARAERTPIKLEHLVKKERDGAMLREFAMSPVPRTPKQVKEAQEVVIVDEEAADSSKVEDDDEGAFARALVGPAKKLYDEMRLPQKRKPGAALMHTEEWFRKLQEERLVLERERFEVTQAELRAAREQREAQMVLARELAQQQLEASAAERSLFRELLLSSMGGGAAKQ